MAKWTNCSGLLAIRDAVCRDDEFDTRMTGKAYLPLRRFSRQALPMEKADLRYLAIDRTITFSGQRRNLS